MPAAPSPLVPSSWRPAAPLAVANLADAFAPVLADLAARGLAPVHVRLYASAESAQTAVEAVQAPRVTVVTTRPCAGGDIAGAHILSAPAEVPVTPVLHDGATVGAVVGSVPPVVVLAGLTAPQNTPATTEFTTLFDAAESLLARHDLRFVDVARTWLHLPALLRDYDALNEARSGFFAPRGIGTDVAPPASTGIQGGSPDGGRLQIDLVATAPGGFRPLASTLQCEAWEYGSAFSRGMALGTDVVTISGTASIGADGDTLHLDDPTAQIRATWTAVKDLLAAQDLPLPPTGPQAWVLYFKSPAVWDAWRALVAAGEVVEPPGAVCMYADVCRDNLLFEMELTAGR